MLYVILLCIFTVGCIVVMSIELNRQAKDIGSLKIESVRMKAESETSDSQHQSEIRALEDRVKELESKEEERERKGNEFAENVNNILSYDYEKSLKAGDIDV